MPKKITRPRKERAVRVFYTEKLADLICKYISSHAVGLDELCNRYPELPPQTIIHRWRHEHPEFGIKFMVAKQQQGEVIGSHILDILDELRKYIDHMLSTDQKIDLGYLAYKKIEIDTYKWQAARLYPKLYGASKEIEINIEKIDEEKEEIIKKLEKSEKREY